MAGNCALFACRGIQDALAHRRCSQRHPASRARGLSVGGALLAAGALLGALGAAAATAAAVAVARLLPSGHSCFGTGATETAMRSRPLPMLAALATGSKAFALVDVDAKVSRLSRPTRGSRQARTLRAGRTGRAASSLPAMPGSLTIEKRMQELDARVQAVPDPAKETYWRLLAYCTACRTPWCKLPWRRHTCLKGDMKAEGTQGRRCDMPWETYTDILIKSVPLIPRAKAQVLTRECWRNGDADPGGIGVVTVTIVPRATAEGYCNTLSKNGIQCSVVPDSFFEGGPSSRLR